ncbi:MAG: hypothetical protein QOF57_2724 [Frankiaceae bacterium]|jgi:hypothetical protein|nr:hypothetical protein [Frankiaceae bacterium]MDQ1726138.1 hypothetical protein [Frankiaceae bacterium]
MAANPSTDGTGPGFTIRASSFRAARGPRPDPSVESL